MLWNDTRSAPEATELRDALGAEAWAERVGVVPVPSFTVTRWAWLRAHGARGGRGRRARCACRTTALTERLCGRAATDRGDASGTGWWSTRDEDYATEVLEPCRARPLAAARRARAARARRRGRGGAAGQLGLPDGRARRPRHRRQHGRRARAWGCGPGEPVVSLGTSGTAYAAMTERAVDPSGLVAGLRRRRGRLPAAGCTLNCTLAVDRVAALARPRPRGRGGAHRGAVLPYLDGERTPNLPHAAGTIAGLRHDTEPGQILLAAYEGAVASLVEALDVLARRAPASTPARR